MEGCCMKKLMYAFLLIAIFSTNITQGMTWLEKLKNLGKTAEQKLQKENLNEAQKIIRSYEIKLAKFNQKPKSQLVPLTAAQNNEILEELKNINDDLNAIYDDQLEAESIDKNELLPLYEYRKLLEFYLVLPFNEEISKSKFEGLEELVKAIRKDFTYYVNMKESALSQLGDNDIKNLSNLITSLEVLNNEKNITRLREALPRATQTEVSNAISNLKEKLSKLKNIRREAQEKEYLTGAAKIGEIRKQEATEEREKRKREATAELQKRREISGQLEKERLSQELKKDEAEVARLQAKIAREKESERQREALIQSEPGLQGPEAKEFEVTFEPSATEKVLPQARQPETLLERFSKFLGGK